MENAAMSKQAIGHAGSLDDGGISVLEKAYLEARAETEINLAQASDHPAVVRAHYLLAGYYLNRLYGQDDEPVSRDGNRSWLGQGRY
jgi:hypothetical protein